MCNGVNIHPTSDPHIFRLAWYDEENDVEIMTATVHADMLDKTVHILNKVKERNDQDY